MKLFVKNSLIRSSLVFVICVSFFLFLINDIYVNNISVFDRELVQERGIERSVPEKIGRRFSNERSEAQIVDLIISSTQIVVFDEYHDDNKFFAISALLRVAVFLTSHLFLMLLFLLRAKSWLVQSNHLVHKIPLVMYLHRKDGKKKYHPLYCQIC